MTAPYFTDVTGPIDFGKLGLPDADAPKHRDLYVRDARGRFAEKEPDLVNDPVRPVSDWEGLVPTSVVGVSGRANYVPVDAPRCPHGSFVRWAAENCCWEGDE